MCSLVVFFISYRWLAGNVVNSGWLGWVSSVGLVDGVVCLSNGRAIRQLQACCTAVCNGVIQGTSLCALSACRTCVSGKPRHDEGVMSHAACGCAHRSSSACICNISTTVHNHITSTRETLIVCTRVTYLSLVLAVHFAGCLQRSSYADADVNDDAALCCCIAAQIMLLVGCRRLLLMSAADDVECC